MSLTAALGWTSLMNGLTGSKGAKSKYQDILPYRLTPSADGEMMKSTKNTLIRLIRENRLPQWAVGEAMKHQSVNRAINGN